MAVMVRCTGAGISDRGPGHRLDHDVEARLRGALGALSSTVLPLWAVVIS